MRLKASVVALVLATGYALLAQSPQQSVPRDDAFVSRHQPAVKLTGEDVPIKDDARGRIEWMREVMGGDLTPEFMEALMTAADEQRAQYGPAGRGAIQVPPAEPGPTSGRIDRTGFRTGSRCRSPIPDASAPSWCIRRTRMCSTS